MEVEGRVVDVLSRPELREAILSPGFRYALVLPGLEGRPSASCGGCPRI